MALIQNEFLFGSRPEWQAIYEATEIGRNGSSVTFEIKIKLRLKGTSSSTFYGYAVNWRATLNGVSSGVLKVKGTERWYGGQGYREFKTTLTTSVGASGGTVPLRIEILPSGGGNASSNSLYNVGYSTWNTPPSMSGALNLSLSGTIPENTGNITLSWNGAYDANNNVASYQIYRFVNGTHNATFNTTGTSYTDNISGFGQGTQIFYKVWAVDTYGEWSNPLQSGSVYKNRFTGANLNINNSCNYDTNVINMGYSGASNTNGNGNFSYGLYSDDIRVYNYDKVTGNPFNLTIVRDGQKPPSTPYILFNDIKRFVSGSGWQRTATFKFRTVNAYGSEAWTSKGLWIDIRTNPNAPTAVTVSGKTKLADGRSYYIPDRGDITVAWSGASDKLGGSLTYEVQGKLGSGNFIALKSGITGTSTTVRVPRVSKEEDYVFRVVAKTNFNYTAYKDSGLEKMHYYNAPTIDFINLNRTAEGVSVDVVTKANTSIPSVGFTKRAYSGLISGTLTASPQKLSKSGLDSGKAYSIVVAIKDNTGLSNEITATISIPVYTPIMAVREKGVGINAIPDGSAKLVVNGGAKVSGGLTVDGKKVLTDESQYLKKSQLTEGTNVYGRIPQIGGDGVIELGKYIDFHLPNSKADFDGRLTLQDNKTLSYNGWMQADAFQGGNLRISGNDFCMNNKRALVGWAGANDPLIINYGGDFKGGIKLEGYTQVTGQLDCRSQPGKWGSQFIAQTQADGNGSGDGQTHIGYNGGNGYSHYFRGTGGFYVNNHLGIHTNKIDVEEWVQAPQLWVKDNGGIYSGHNNAYILKDHGNGNVTLSASGGQLYLGYQNTSSIKVEQEYWDLGASSGCMLRMSSPWSGSSGSEPSIFNSKGKGWGFLGNSDWSWYRVYGTGGSVSKRSTKYDIHKYDNELLYQFIKDLNTYAYRTLSNVADEDGSIVENIKRSDMQLGCMIEELPTEVVLYDDEGGNGGAVDNYSFTTMAIGAIKVLQNKVETLEEEKEKLSDKVVDLEDRIKKLEEMVLNGIS